LRKVFDLVLTYLYQKIIKVLFRPVLVIASMIFFFVILLGLPIIEGNHHSQSSSNNDEVLLSSFEDNNDEGGFSTNNVNKKKDHLRSSTEGNLSLHDELPQRSRKTKTRKVKSRRIFHKISKNKVMSYIIPERSIQSMKIKLLRKKKMVQKENKTITTVD
jgi:hypothetical protein